VDGIFEQHRGQCLELLNAEKKQQVLALGRLGWSLRRIQQATGIRRETAGAKHETICSSAPLYISKSGPEFAIIL